MHHVPYVSLGNKYYILYFYCDLNIINGINHFLLNLYLKW